MPRLAGWRAALWAVLALVTLALLLSALFWIGIGLAVLAAVVWFNLLVLPRVAARLHIPQLPLAVLLLPVLAGLGFVLRGSPGLAGGCGLWLVGVALPRAALWRAQRRLRSRTQSSTPVRVIEPEYRYRP